MSSTKATHSVFPTKSLVSDKKFPILAIQGYEELSLGTPTIIKDKNLLYRIVNYLCARTTITVEDVTGLKYEPVEVNWGSDKDPTAFIFKLPGERILTLKVGHDGVTVLTGNSAARDTNRVGWRVVVHTNMITEPLENLVSFKYSIKGTDKRILTPETIVLNDGSVRIDPSYYPIHTDYDYTNYYERDAEPASEPDQLAPIGVTHVQSYFDPMVVLQVYRNPYNEFLGIYPAHKKGCHRVVLSARPRSNREGYFTFKKLD